MLITALVAPVSIPIAALLLVLGLAKLERVLVDEGDRPVPEADRPETRTESADAASA
ncbi:hypothetical protein [Actinoallomurus rhizosphaericola]|uniref:hypothetical protein n=1 Tax=Actinoallomurus rhizosphaericola TaxID=2952536 RepID=UPI0020918537|nr:hypothetical protein [Actinoallomurus rhizosphaericola]MCO5994256.1 hypothetical protein [Actinoallomurus rhizosphaericola]